MSSIIQLSDLLLLLVYYTKLINLFGDDIAENDKKIENVHNLLKVSN